MYFVWGTGFKKHCEMEETINHRAIWKFRPGWKCNFRNKDIGRDSTHPSKITAVYRKSMLCKKCAIKIEIGNVRKKYYTVAACV